MDFDFGDLGPSDTDAEEGLPDHDDLHDELSDSDSELMEDEIGERLPESLGRPLCRQMMFHLQLCVLVTSATCWITKVC